MEKIAIFGASGKTGRRVLERAVDAGYGVQALARHPARMRLRSDRVVLVQGDVLEPDAVDRTVEQGCPIGAIAIEAPPEVPALRTATGEAFQAWSARIADAFVTHEVPHEVAKDLGKSAAAALEGAILVSKSAKNTEALTLTANMLAHAVA